MKSKALASLGVFVFLLSAYITYALSLMNETDVSSRIAVAGLAPLIFYILVWLVCSRFPDIHKPHHVWGWSMFALIYWIVGFVLFSFSFDISFYRGVVLASPLIICGIVFYALGAVRFNSLDEESRLRRSVCVTDGCVELKDPGLIMHYSYSNKFGWVWLEKIFIMGRRFFLLMLVMLFILGGGIGIFLVRLLEMRENFGYELSSHGLVVYFLSFFCIPVMSFGAPMIRFHYKWWRDLDKNLKKTYGSAVTYKWPLD